MIKRPVEDRIPVGIASSVLAIENYNWKNTSQLARKLNVSIVQLHLNQFDSLSGLMQIQKKFSDVILHLPTKLNYNHPLILNFNKSSSIPILIQHDKYLDNKTIDFFIKNQFTLGFENDRERDIDAYLSRLSYLKSLGLKLKAVLDCPRYFHQFYKEAKPEIITDKILHILNWCKHHNTEIIIHAIDVKSFNPDKSNWTQILTGIIPWKHLLEIVINRAIPVRSIIFEYEDIDMTEKSVYSLRQLFQQME
ncbi:MAG: hypothetical protein P8X42_16905 [Calditrichaceae bacterium]